MPTVDFDYEKTEELEDQSLALEQLSVLLIAALKGTGGKHVNVQQVSPNPVRIAGMKDLAAKFRPELAVGPVDLALDPAPAPQAGNPANGASPQGHTAEEGGATAQTAPVTLTTGAVTDASQKDKPVSPAPAQAKGGRAAKPPAATDPATAPFTTHQADNSGTPQTSAANAVVAAMVSGTGSHRIQYWRDLEGEGDLANAFDPPRVARRLEDTSTRWPIDLESLTQEPKETEGFLVSIGVLERLGLAYQQMEAVRHYLGRSGSPNVVTADACAAIKAAWNNCLCDLSELDKQLGLAANWTPPQASPAPDDDPLLLGLLPRTKFGPLPDHGDEYLPPVDSSGGALHLIQSNLLYQRPSDADTAPLLNHRRSLLGQLVRLRALYALIKANKEGSSLSEKAKNASESCHRKFFEILKSVLLLQRPLEEVIRSLHSFFEEAHSDGRARSVHLFNGTWNEASGEFLGKAAGAAGEPNAVTLVDFKEKSVVQTMCTAFAVAENFTGNQAVSAAIAAHKAGAVGFVNISPDRLPKKAEGVEESLATIRTEFTGMRDYYKNLVLVANHPVVREGVVWKRDNGHSETEPAVLGYPAFALLGKVHKLRWSGGGRCMTSSPIKPSEDHIPVGAGSWLKGLSCPYLLDQRSQLDSVRVAFLQESDNLRGDAIVVHFNTACTAFSGLKRVPFVLTLGRIWLERVVLHHLLQCAGAANTDFEARRIGRSLNLKLGTMSSPFDETRPFVRAWVDWESSRCVREAEVDPLTKQPRIDESGKEVRTGRLTHEHEVHVQYREGVEVFKVRVVPEQGV